MTKDETLAILREFKREHGDEYGIVEIGLFGSIARDAAVETSDVDVCVKTQTPNPFLLVHMKDDLETRIKRRVDLVRVRDSMNPFLKARIEEEGTYL